MLLLDWYWPLSVLSCSCCVSSHLLSSRCIIIIICLWNTPLERITPARPSHQRTYDRDPLADPSSRLVKSISRPVMLRLLSAIAIAPIILLPCLPSLTLTLTLTLLLSRWAAAVVQGGGLWWCPLCLSCCHWEHTER